MPPKAIQHLLQRGIDLTFQSCDLNAAQVKALVAANGKGVAMLDQCDISGLEIILAQADRGHRTIVFSKQCPSFEEMKEELFNEIQAFDEELSTLKSIKYQLQSDMNLVEMKILTYAQEFIIFRDM